MVFSETLDACSKNAERSSVVCFAKVRSGGDIKVRGEWVRTDTDGWIAENL